MRRSKSSERRALQKARRESATPRPTTNFELAKQRIDELEDRQREDRETLRHLEQTLQKNRRRTEPATGSDAGSEIESRMERRLSEPECRVFGWRPTSMEPGMGEDVGATSPVASTTTSSWEIGSKRHDDDPWARYRR